MFRISFVLSVLLIVGGFFCPPIGVIDGSVHMAVGLLLILGSRKVARSHQGGQVCENPERRFCGRGWCGTM